MELWTACLAAASKGLQSAIIIVRLTMSKGTMRRPSVRFSGSIRTTERSMS